MKKIFVLLLGILFLLYFVVIVLLYLFQERLIFLPRVLPHDHTFSKGSEIWFESEGIRLHGLRFAKKNASGVIVYFHGNAGSLESWGDVHEYFQHLPYEVWIYDYRGYGKSQGRVVSEKGLHVDARAFLEEVRRVHPQKRLIYYGRSLGSGIAAELARFYPPEILILETPYFNFPDVVSSIYPFAPSFLVRYKLRTDQVLSSIDIPVHLLHGTKDGLIPYSSSVRLEKLGDNITLHTFEGAEHNNIPSMRQYQNLINTILRE